MRKFVKYGIVVMAIAVVVASLWMYHTHEFYEKTYGNKYHYRITIESDSILHNITLFVPLPVFEGESRIGNEIIAGNASKPDNWDCSIVETEHGKMLKIRVDNISYGPLSPPPLPEVPPPPTGAKPSNVNAPEYVQHVPHFNVSDSLSVNVDAYYINTINPVGNEPLLSPRYNVTKLSLDCYEYESCIYLDYTTSSPTATVRISVSMDGTNEWYYRQGDVLKSGGNTYIDSVNIILSEKQHGWHVASGELDENLVAVSAGMSAELDW